MNEEMEVDFCRLVEAYVSKHYQLDDGADLCFTLLESGRISEDATIEEAARIVAQHLLQP